MKTYKYWSRITDDKFSAYGYSNTSESDANNSAEQRLHELKNALNNGTVKNWYQYTDHPIREEVKDEIMYEDKRIAIITRNLYGALILNSEKVMFIDIDDKSSGNGLLQLFIKLLKPGSSTNNSLVEKINSILSERGLSGALYKTKNGHRLLILNRTFDPTSSESDELMMSLDVDPLYAKLCKAQECYRARISPKPWNLGFRLPGKGSASYPWKDSETEMAQRQWESEYDSAIQDYSTCTLVADNLGVSASTASEVQIIRDIHDKHVIGGGRLA